MVDKLENFFKVNTWYSVTLNPIDKHQFCHKVDRYDKFHQFMYEQLSYLKCTYEFFIEISEPRGMHIKGYMGPRLHLHGKVRFKSRVEIAHFLLRDYYRLLRFCSVDIDSIDDLRKWYKYCTKQLLFKDRRLSSFEECE